MWNHVSQLRDYFWGPCSTSLESRKTRSLGPPGTEAFLTSVRELVLRPGAFLLGEIHGAGLMEVCWSRPRWCSELFSKKLGWFFWFDFPIASSISSISKNVKKQKTIIDPCYPDEIYHKIAMILELRSPFLLAKSSWTNHGFLYRHPLQHAALLVAVTLFTADLICLAHPVPGLVRDIPGHSGGDTDGTDGIWWSQ